MFFKSKNRIVAENSMFWGSDVSDTYHANAERDMQMGWDNIIWPILTRHPIDFKKTADFACGHGRNTDKLLSLAETVTMIDVNLENVDYCSQKYHLDSRVTVKSCNGYDLSNIDNESFSFFYTFDSMVHFPQEIVFSYLPEIYRVLESGGYAFIHHSNYTDGGKNRDFRKNPHWRNYMSAKLFSECAKKNHFEIAEQKFIDWEIKNLDCITVLFKI